LCLSLSGGIAVEDMIELNSATVLEIVPFEADIVAGTIRLPHLCSQDSIV